MPRTQKELKAMENLMAESDLDQLDGRKIWDIAQRAFTKNEKKIHGNEMIFDSPIHLWKEACKYFKWMDRSPFIIVEAVKSGDLAGKLIKMPKKKPYTLDTFCLFLGVSPSYFRTLKSNVINGKNPPNASLLTVFEHVEGIIKSQKFEGASSGLFNSAIISRDLGLVDKKELGSDPDRPVRVTGMKIIDDIDK